MPPPRPTQIKAQSDTQLSQTDAQRDVALQQMKLQAEAQMQETALRIKAESEMAIEQLKAELTIKLKGVELERWKALGKKLTSLEKKLYKLELSKEKTEKEILALAGSFPH